MSNNKIIKKLNKIKPIKEKYILFNEFLNDLENKKSKESSIDSNNKKNSLPLNKRNLLKYAKIDGSKNFLLSATNSILSKDDININSNNVNIILDNLDFISANSKYINNIQPQTQQSQQHSSPKNNFKNNDFFSSSTSSISQKNLFFINKQNIFSNMDSLANNDSVNNNCNDLNKNKYKNNENYFNIQNMPNLNFSEKNDLYKETKNTILTNELTNNMNINMSMNMSNMSLDKSHSNTCLYRQDYYIKQFKVQYSIWLRNYLNHKLKLLIEETKNCRKHLKFYPLNSLKFTANPKYEDNKYFLSLKIKEILIVGIDSIKSSNQKKNKENIETIENKIYKENKNANKDLLQFLNSSMEDSIKIFYESEQFQKFKNNDQTRLNDAKFVQEKSFSLLADNGFIHLIKNYKGNAKSTISFIHS
jgi:hypothetical protein